MRESITINPITASSSVIPTEESATNGGIPSKGSFDFVRFRWGRQTGWFVAILLLQIVSFFTLSHSVSRSVITLLIGCLMIWLGYRRPVLGMSALAVELLIGSKGHLLAVMFGGADVALRIVMVAGFLLGWILNVVHARAWMSLVSWLRAHLQYLVLGLILIYALIRGLLLNTPSLVIADANAWGALILLLPAVDLARRYREDLYAYLLPALYAGFIWLVVETCFLAYLFSHDFSTLSPALYLWIRKTGVGEVTRVVGSVFRVFFQSHIYALPVLFLTWSWIGVHPGKPKKSIWIACAVSISVLLISLSRSFWLGAAAGGFVSLVLLTIQRTGWWKRLPYALGAVVTGTLLTVILVLFPIPKTGGASLLDVLRARADTGEAAASTRWILLPALTEKIKQHPLLGSGFGATVSYASKDPRVLQMTQGGLYTTYAFEWGWLEHWIKFGILGVPLMLWIIVGLTVRLWKQETMPLWLRVGSVSSLAGLMVVHAFTPYLNHPLGFLFLFVGEGILIWYSNSQFFPEPARQAQGKLR